ncbi:ROK family protein [Parafilimonas sp.]|uniref:ROK family protein n=1 Tax=Parafilimonas sp. TaxID=1969739 RepID=UPI003F8213EE
MNNFFIGIDLGGTRIKLGLISNDEGNNRLLDKKIIPAQSAKGLATSLPIIKDHINNLLNSNNVDINILKGIGLGFPGLVNPQSNQILSTNAKYDDALHIKLDEWVHANWNVDFFMDNDARLAAVGEWKYGAGSDTDDLVVMTIGTGIGTSVIMNGQLMRGKHFEAGCLGGHISVVYNGRQCTCGNKGCVEAYAATWSLKERIREHEAFSKSSLSTVDVIDFEAMFNEADKQDALAIEFKNDCIQLWAAAIVNLIHAYDPEVVVIGGGVMHRHEELIPRIKELVHQHAWTPWGKVEIEPSQLLSDAGIYGAVYCLQNRI